MERGKSKKKITISDHVGNNVFPFRNGDIYRGNYYATSKGKIYRQGEGCYTTHEKQQYQRIWKEDRLEEEAFIYYPDDSSYRGPVSLDLVYEGEGRYIFADKTILRCTFRENTPVGMLELTDPHEHAWRGISHVQCGYFMSENKFLQEIRAREKPESEVNSDDVEFEREDDRDGSHKAGSSRNSPDRGSQKPGSSRNTPDKEGSQKPGSSRNTPDREVRDLDEDLEEDASEGEKTKGTEK